MTELTPRKTPCASCPYRRNVPSGIWDASEYDKLPAYDGETFEQPVEIFMCHQQDGCMCAGWFAYRDPYDLLAVRLGLVNGSITAHDVVEYSTDVPLFSSGAEAAEHGKRDIQAPDERALLAMDKLERKRELDAS